MQLLREGGVDSDGVADEGEPGVPITRPFDSVTVSDFKPRKRGLNSRLRPVLQGGGLSNKIYNFKVYNYKIYT